MTDPDIQPEFAAQLIEVSKFYPDGQVRAVDGISLDIRMGEYLAIMGPSGSGKSTLLNLLGVLDHPDHGRVCIHGREVTAKTDVNLLRSRHLGFIFQSFHLLPTLNVLENIQVPMMEGPLPRNGRIERAKLVLDSVGMSHRAKHYPNRLSVGERQRVAVARALANGPALVLADEPTGNLDSRNAQDILDLFDKIHRESETTFVVITHGLDVARRAERIVTLCDGRIASDHRQIRNPAPLHVESFARDRRPAAAVA